MNIEKLKEIYAKEKGFDSWYSLTNSCINGIYLLEEHMNEVAKRHSLEVAHSIVNDAVNSPNYIRQRGSNYSAEFVDKWFKDKNI